MYVVTSQKNVPILIRTQTAKSRIRQAMDDKRESNRLGKQMEETGTLFHFIANSDMVQSDRTEE